MGTSRPVVGMDATFPFQVAAVSWFDLLGYGAMIAEAGFSPLHPKAKEALKRLRTFHQIVADHSARHFPTLVMNDGAAAYRDLSLRARSVTYDFFERSWNLHAAINAEERRQGLPGVRLVLATGYRMRGRRAGMDATKGHFQSLLRRFQKGEIDVDRALHEAAAMRPKFDIEPQLQANFAFTKAYLAESSGSAGGLPGARFYLDTAIIRGRPQWLDLGPDIPWRHDGLGIAATFVEVRGITPQRADPGPIDMLDGLEVAQRIEGNPDVLASLRQALKP